MFLLCTHNSTSKRWLVLIRRRMCRQEAWICPPWRKLRMLRMMKTMITSHFLTTVNNSLKAVLVDPSQSHFVGSFGMSDELITKCWEKILKECGK
jgi:hypothetical protein